MRKGTGEEEVVDRRRKAGDGEGDSSSSWKGSSFGGVMGSRGWDSARHPGDRTVGGIVEQVISAATVQSLGRGLRPSRDSLQPIQRPPFNPPPRPHCPRSPSVAEASNQESLTAPSAETHHIVHHSHDERAARTRSNVFSLAELSLYQSERVSEQSGDETREAALETNPGDLEPVAARARVVEHLVESFLCQ